jgi:hypothetical protein
MAKDIKLDGKITLLSPLSHIGESLGIDSYLSTDYIIGPDGAPVECFVYSGNSFRGILRDMASVYLLNKLGGCAVPLETFHLLFSGGSIGGSQSIDIDQARKYRQALPALSIFGGGVGNQIMEGKLKIGAMYPLVRECQRIIPERYMEGIEDPLSWKKWSFEKSYTRRDDSKQENMRQYIVPAETEGLLPGTVTTPQKKDGPATQMRYTVELMCAGAIFYQRVHLQDLTDLELGAFISALCEFSKRPYLGGKSGTGHGLCQIEYEYSYPGDEKPQGVFVKVDDNRLWLSGPASEAKEAYDDFLLKLYDGYLEEKEPELKQLLAGGK